MPTQKTFRDIANDIQSIKHTGSFPKGRAHMYVRYKKEGIVKIRGTKTILVKDDTGYQTGKIPRVTLTPKGKAMYEQLKGVI